MKPGDLSDAFRDGIGNAQATAQVAARLREHPEVPADQVMLVADLAVHAANSAMDALDAVISRLPSHAARQCAAGIALSLVSGGSKMLVEAIAAVARERGAHVSYGSLRTGS